MYELVLLTAVLLRDHQAEFKAGWEHARARAEIKDQRRHGLIGEDAYWARTFEHLTPQEKAAILRKFEDMAKDIPRHEEILRQLEERQRKAGLIPPKTPDVK